MRGVVSLDGTQSRLNIGQLLRIPYQQFLARLHDGLAAAGYPDIHPAHGNNIFQHLDTEGTRLTDLAERAQLTKQSVGDLVEYLEARGYIERVPDPVDGRAKLIRLTAKGWEVTAVAEELIWQIEMEWAQRLGQDSLEQLRSSLERLASAPQV